MPPQPSQARLELEVNRVAQYKTFRIAVEFPDHTEAALNKFLRQHHVLTVDRHFIADGARSAWSICVVCDDNVQDTNT